MQLESRREAVQPPPTSDPGEPRLVELLRAEIERDGPLTFARFMERALYEPGLGYYAASAERPTRSGDFLTAPELHPLFGHVLARQLHEMWERLGEPGAFELREYGAGRGALAAAIVEGLGQVGSGLTGRLAYQPRDLPAQLSALESRLGGANSELNVQAAPSHERIVGCVLANEFLDALPIHRVLSKGGRLHELYVDWRDGRFVEIVGEPSQERLAEWFSEAGIELTDGQRAEINLAMLEWLAQVGRDLERGYVLVIDYGALPAELYGPERRDGTLRAFRQQHVSSGVLFGVGRQDLTAHVDLRALEWGAQEAGLDILGRTTQAEFLVGAGLQDAMTQARDRLGDSWQDQLLLRSAVGRLLDPRALGGYAVVVLGRDVSSEPPLRGLAYQVPARS